MTDAHLDYLATAKAQAAEGLIPDDPTAGQEAALAAREREIVSEIGRVLTEHVTSPSVTLVLEMSELHRTASSSLKAVDAEGTRTSVRHPLALHSLESELRTVTYRPSRGAFFGATVTVAAEGATVEYNFDAIEPRHAEFAPADIAPAFHADIKRYPRREPAIPGWLAEMLQHSPVVRLAHKR